MSDYQFHSFPFYSFLKENKLGSGGMNQRFISTLPLSPLFRRRRNRWEAVGTGDCLPTQQSYADNSKSEYRGGKREKENGKSSVKVK